MTTRRRNGITDALRARLLGALRSGVLRGGARLPSTRELATEFDADPRVVADAYRTLAGEGLVELRPRSGVFLAELSSAERGDDARHAAWLARVIADAACRGISVPALAGTITRASTVRPMTAVAIAPTLDQTVGLARELRHEFGIDARSLVDDQLARGEALPRVVVRANLLVGTRQTASCVTRLGDRLGKPAVVIDPRPDLLNTEWQLLLRGPSYVVVADPRFRPFVHELVRDADGATDVRVVVAGRDDLSEIPPDVPTYVTEAARQMLGPTRLPGRVLPQTRTMCDESVRALTAALVAHNLAVAPPRRPRAI